MIKVKFKFILLYIALFLLQLFINEKIFFIMFYGITIIVVIELIYLILIYNFTTAKFKDNEIILKVKEKRNIKVFINNKFSLPVFYLKLAYRINNENEVETVVSDLFYRNNVSCNIKMYFERRGEYIIKNFELYFMDFLNIFTLRKLAYKQYKIKVYPYIRKLNIKVKYSNHKLNDDVSTKGSLEDLVQIKNIRKYYLGDPIKRIHWKISAKHSEFFVKDFESISGGNQLIIFNMNQQDYGINKIENDEDMVSFLCSVIKLYLLKNQSIDLRIFSKDIDNFLIKYNSDYSMLMEYFLKKSIEHGDNFIDTIVANAAFYKTFKDIFLFTPIITRELVNNLDALNNVGIKYSIFHLGKSSIDALNSLDILQIKTYAFNSMIL